MSQQDHRPLSVVLQYDGAWWSFSDLDRAVVAGHPAEVRAAIDSIETMVEREGLYAAGYLTYEAAAAYGLAVHEAEPEGPPPLWFGLFRAREQVEPPAGWGDYQFGAWQPALDFQAYAAAIARIKDAIAAGHTYQANFTFPLRAPFSGEPWALLASLSGAQRARHCAYFDLGRHVICSASPELFFSLDGDCIVSRPMKGTAPRGLTLADDQRQGEWLRTSEKNRAENVMIVDMIRNDLGRVAHTGSVHVPELFAIERYPTLFQMTSTVAARTLAPLSEILAAVYPCASITGAPKVRTMQLLRELEPGPRGVYTGAIGCILPDRKAQFNVAIRTAVIDRQRGIASYGVGSGVVWDSDAGAEYAECLLKARVLEAGPAGAFQLLESLLWTPDGGYFLLERHLRRLSGSAEYFGFSIDIDDAERRLSHYAEELEGASKVRLLATEDGQLQLEAGPLGTGVPPSPVRIGLARDPVSSSIVWLYHKTTRRELYAAARASRPECDEVVLWNERGELTEASASNIVLLIDGRLYTPPVRCGLLAGTFRAHLLEAGEIEERVLTVADLDSAGQAWLINSVRGWQAAEKA